MRIRAVETNLWGALFQEPGITVSSYMFISVESLSPWSQSRANGVTESVVDDLHFEDDPAQ